MIADWLILLICIPAVVIPIVLLCGFAGCGQVFGLQHLNPPIPANIRALERTLSSITITWDTIMGDTFLVKAWGEGEAEPKDADAVTVSTNEYLDDGNYPEGTPRYYRVATVNSDQDKSSFSARFDTSTRAFQLACSGLQPFPGVDNVNAALDGMTLVEVIKPGLLLAGGEYVRVVVRGAVNPAATALALNAVYMSTVASGGDPWDSDPATLTPLFEWDGVTPLLIPQGQTHEFGPIEFHFDQMQPVMIAFNVGSPSGSRYALVPNDTYAVAYDKFVTQEAGVADRSSGYQTSNALWYIDSIYVA
jgi:hypothetical protein